MIEKVLNKIRTMQVIDESRAVRIVWFSQAGILKFGCMQDCAVKLGFPLRNGLRGWNDLRSGLMRSRMDIYDTPH